MSLDYNLMKRIEESLIDKGYPILDKGLVVFGGKNNGTVDLKASNKDNSKSIIIEIKSNPIHLIDLSHFLILKRNIEMHNLNRKEKLLFYLITSENDTDKILKEIANEKGIIIENINNFLKRTKL